MRLVVLLHRVLEVAVEIDTVSSVERAIWISEARGHLASFLRENFGRLLKMHAVEAGVVDTEERDDGERYEDRGKTENCDFRTHADGFSGSGDHFGRRGFAGRKGRGKWITSGQRGGDCQCIRRTRCRILFQATQDHSLDERVEIFHHRSWPAGSVIVIGARSCFFLGESTLSRKNLVQHETERIDVA